MILAPGLAVFRSLLPDTPVRGRSVARTGRRAQPASALARRAAARSLVLARSFAALPAALAGGRARVTLHPVGSVVAGRSPAIGVALAGRRVGAAGGGR